MPTGASRITITALAAVILVCALFITGWRSCQPRTLPGASPSDPSPGSQPTKASTPATSEQLDREPIHGEARQRGVAATASSLRVVVLTPAGTAIAGAKVRVLGTPSTRGQIPIPAPWQRRHEERTTDELGLARFEHVSTAPEGVTVIADMDGYSSDYFEAARPGQQIELQLRPLALRRGLVSVDGKAPTESLQLRVQPIIHKELLAADHTRNALRRTAVDVSVSPSAGGAFEFPCPSGAPSVVVEAPAPYLTKNGRPPHFVFESGDELDVALQLGSALEVEVAGVDLATCAPLQLRLTMRSRNEAIQRSLHPVSPDVPFRTSFSSDVQQIECEVLGPTALGQPILSRASTNAPMPRRNVLLIDLSKQMQQLVVFVTDDQGAPIPTARLLSARGRSNVDAAGRATVEVAREEKALLVGAPGFGARRVPIPAGARTPLAVALHAAGTVALDVEGEVNHEHFSVQVEVAGNWFEQSLIGPPDNQLRADGSWRCADLPTDRPVTIRLCDASGSELFARSLSLAAGANRRLKARISSSQTFRIRLVDADGANVAGAWVQQLHANLPLPVGSPKESGAQGCVELQSPSPQGIRIQVTKPGFARVQTRIKPRHSSVDTPVNLVMDRSRALLVRLTRSDGQTETRDHTLLFRREPTNGEEEACTATRVAPGLYRFSNVAQRPGKVWCANAHASAVVLNDDRLISLSVGQ